MTQTELEKAAREYWKDNKWEPENLETAFEDGAKWLYEQCRKHLIEEGLPRYALMDRLKEICEGKHE